MTEKRGDLVKLSYDFDTTALLEVKMNGNWYRATSKRFRSFDGERKITAPVSQPGHGIEGFKNIEFNVIEYEGPVFIFGTNTQVPFKNTGKYIESPERPMWGAPDQETLDLMAEKRLLREIKL